jgi:hypothetical protein
MKAQESLTRHISCCRRAVAAAAAAACTRAAGCHRGQRPTHRGASQRDASHPAPRRRCVSPPPPLHAHTHVPRAHLAKASPASTCQTVLCPRRPSQSTSPTLYRSTSLLLPPRESLASESGFIGFGSHFLKNNLILFFLLASVSRSETEEKAVRSECATWKAEVEKLQERVLALQQRREGASDVDKLQFLVEDVTLPYCRSCFARTQQTRTRTDTHTTYSHGMYMYRSFMHSRHSSVHHSCGRSSTRIFATHWISAPANSHPTHRTSNPPSTSRTCNSPHTTLCLNPLNKAVPPSAVSPPPISALLFFPPPPSRARGLTRWCGVGAVGGTAGGRSRQAQAKFRGRRARDG